MGQERCGDAMQHQLQEARGAIIKPRAYLRSMVRLYWRYTCAYVLWVDCRARAPQCTPAPTSIYFIYAYSAFNESHAACMYDISCHLSKPELRNNSMSGLPGRCPNVRVFQAASLQRPKHYNTKLLLSIRRFWNHTNSTANAYDAGCVLPCCAMRSVTRMLYCEYLGQSVSRLFFRKTK